MTPEQLTQFEADKKRIQCLNDGVWIHISDSRGGTNYLHETNLEDYGSVRIAITKYPLKTEITLSIEQPARASMVVWDSWGAGPTIGDIFADFLPQVFQKAVDRYQRTRAETEAWWAEMDAQLELRMENG